MTRFLKDLQILGKMPCLKRYQKLALAEYPFDLQALSHSRLYRESRKMYLAVGGIYTPKMISLMRGLSAQDLFKDEIEYSPCASEIFWFQKNHHELADATGQLGALSQFQEISLFHEQNHRVLWRLLPPAPSSKREVCQYLNFAESLVVMLDLALADEMGSQYSPALERMSVLYRTGGQHTWHRQGKQVYRQYLQALMAATYFILELVHPEDLLKAVDFVLPGQKKINRQAVERSLDIDELFPRVTNPEWQQRHWSQARKKLKSMHAGTEESPLFLPQDPLDLEEEFVIAKQVLDFYGL